MGEVPKRIPSDDERFVADTTQDLLNILEEATSAEDVPETTIEGLKTTYRALGLGNEADDEKALSETQADLRGKIETQFTRLGIQLP